MKSKTSFCNGTLLRKNIRRFAPLWAMFSVLLLLMGPVYLFNRDRGWMYSYTVAMYFDDLSYAGLFILPLYAPLCAAVCFKYLHRTGEAFTLHALPLTRGCHFTTNLLSGLLFALVPMLVMGVLDVVVLAANGLPWLGQMLCRWTLLWLFCYGLAVFCMVISGRTVIAILSYCGLNVVGWFLPFMLQGTLLQNLFLGYVPKEFYALSPLLWLGMNGMKLTQAGIWIYAGLGLLLIAAAWLHYRKRHLERAGDALVHAWLRPVFAVLFSASVGLLLGWLLAAIFDSKLYGYLCWLAVCTAVGWLFAQMMLRRTVRVWKGKHWIGLAALLGVFLAAVLCLRFDVLGWQREVPAAERIESVELSTLYRERDRITVTDAEDVETLRQFHARVLEACDRERNERFLGFVGDDGLYESLRLTYHLKDGTTLTRVYPINAALTDRDTAALGALYEDPDYVAQIYERALGGTVELAYLERVTVLNPEAAEDEIECTDPRALKDAILTDVRAGRLGISNRFTSDFGGAFGAFGDPNAALQLSVAMDRLDRGDRWVFIQLPDSATATLALFPGVK